LWENARRNRAAAAKTFQHATADLNIPFLNNQTIFLEPRNKSDLTVSIFVFNENDVTVSVF
jgi:hypothetical protein